MTTRVTVETTNKKASVQITGITNVDGGGATRKDEWVDVLPESTAVLHIPDEYTTIKIKESKS